jgi:hypothetical protein
MMSDDYIPYDDGAITGEIVESTERAMLNISAGREEMDTSLAVMLSRAELDQSISTARAYPRSIQAALDRVTQLATLDPETAEECRYAVPRGKDKSGKAKEINGPSVRLAEITASQWGNCRAEARVTVIDKTDGFVEAEGMFHDLETNYAIRARVRRSIRGKSFNGKPGSIFSDDMINVTGNAAAAIAFRNAVFKGVPKAIWRPAYQKVEAVIKGTTATLSARRVQLIAAFVAAGISEPMLYQILGVKGEADIGLDELLVARGFYTGLKNGELTKEDLLRQAGPQAGPGIASPNAGTKPAVAPPKEAKKAPPAAKVEPAKVETATAGGETPDLPSADPGDTLEIVQEPATAAVETAQASATVEADPDAWAALWDRLDTLPDWPAIHATVGAFRKTEAFAVATDDEKAALIRHVVALALSLETPPDPRHDVAFFSLWAEVTDGKQVGEAFVHLMRTPSYKALREESRDWLCDLSDAAEKRG